MNLYLLSLPSRYNKLNPLVNCYRKAVVAAKDEDQARLIHPADVPVWDGTEGWRAGWCEAREVEVRLIGQAAAGTQSGVIVAEYEGGI